MPFQGDELPLALNTNERRRPAYLGASLSLSFSCFFRHLAGRALSYERPPLVPTSLMQHLSLSRGAREAANRRPPFLFPRRLRVVECVERLIPQRLISSGQDPTKSLE